MAVRLPGDDERVRRIIAELETQQTTQGAGPVQIDPVDGGAVLNALTDNAKPLSDTNKASDGCVSLQQAARIAGMKKVTLCSWIDKGFIAPTLGKGKGNHRRFNLRDLTAICTASDLRAQNVTVRAIRLIQSKLREYDRDLSSARLALLKNGEDEVSEVVLVDSESSRKRLIVSVYDTPGQQIIADIPLAPVTKRVARAYGKALKEKPALRGQRKGQRATSANAAGSHHRSRERLAGGRLALLSRA
jgi:DNA-binding transcriptional MerR regulator